MKVFLKPISIVFIALSCLVLVESKDVGGGGGRGSRVDCEDTRTGGGGAGAGFGGNVGVVSNVGRSKFRGKPFGRPGLRSRNGISGGGAAVIVGGGAGAAGYIAYKAHQNAKKDRERDDKDGGDFDPFEKYDGNIQRNPGYKLQEAPLNFSNISASKGISAWTFIFIALTVINLESIAATYSYLCGRITDQ